MTVVRVRISVLVGVNTTQNPNLRNKIVLSGRTWLFDE